MIGCRRDLPDADGAVGFAALHTRMLAVQGISPFPNVCNTILLPAFHRMRSPARGICATTAMVAQTYGVVRNVVPSTLGGNANVVSVR